MTARPSFIPDRYRKLREKWSTAVTAALTADEKTLRGTGGLQTSWYCAVAGVDLPQKWAIRHYLLTGSAQGIPPHPLMDPELIRTHGVPEGVDPVAHYLRTPSMWNLSPHGLLDVEAYCDAHPEALTHPGGPAEHYRTVALPAGEPLGVARLEASEVIGLLTHWTAVLRGAGSHLPVAPASTLLLAKRSERFARLTTLARSLHELTDDSDRAPLWFTTAGLGLASSLQIAAVAHRTGVQVALERAGADVRRSWRRLVTESGADVVVVLDADVLLEPGWLPPLVQAVREGAAGAGSVVLDRDGSVRTAGVCFCELDARPQSLWYGFTIEDLPAQGTAEVAAVAGGALAMSADALITAGDLNGKLHGGLQSADFSLRVKEAAGGDLVVCHDSRLVHWGRREGDPLVDRDVDLMRFTARWQNEVPRNDVAAWAERGVAVEHVDSDVNAQSSENAGHRRRLIRPPDSLRWALKNPAPPGERGLRWGDTHFVHELATALRRLGHEVVVDAAPAFDRPAAELDDVVLLLRGIRQWQPPTHQVSIMWAISHPDEIERDELSHFSVCAAASDQWAEIATRDSAQRVVPLLQATDPALFHPDLAEPDSGPEVLFVGGAREEGRPLVQWALDAGLPLTVIGPGWRGAIPESVWKGEYVARDEVGALYRSAGLVLCDHWADMALRGFVSNRVFDVVAAGGRAVSDAVAGIEQAVPGVVVVTSPDELRAVYEASRAVVFGADDVVRARARHTAELHSFDRRAEQLTHLVYEARAHASE